MLSLSDRLGVKVKMAAGVRLAIAEETGHCLGPGGKYSNLEDMILNVHGSAGVFPAHKCKIVKRLQGLGHLCAITGVGANDGPALSQPTLGRPP
ncbi:hypothetical protein HD554DRAFT_2170788 [Boletus coccyginus]|nr:hypothetical protein HD554DRAFT_2170788 [Boletus coccyginus]